MIIFKLSFHLEYPFRWQIWRESTTRIQENYLVIAERVVHLQGCWFLSMHQMALYTSIYIVRQHFQLFFPNLLEFFSYVRVIYRRTMSADGEACQLSWTRRMKIILGIARGLKYLHTELQPPFTIYLLNSNAVYLTDDFFPKVNLMSLFTFSVLYMKSWFET